MSENAIGKLYKRDRCGATDFVKMTNLSAVRGHGDLPEFEHTNFMAFFDVGTLCPSCYERYRIWKQDFLSMRDSVKEVNTDGKTAK